MACVCKSVLLIGIVEQQQHHGQAIETPCRAALRSQVLSDYRAAFVLNMAAGMWILNNGIYLAIHHHRHSRNPFACYGAGAKKKPGHWSHQPQHNIVTSVESNVLFYVMRHEHGLSVKTLGFFWSRTLTSLIAFYIKPTFASKPAGAMSHTWLHTPDCDDCSMTAS